ncbi:MAG: hypothetical protein CGU29_03030 [Candidatus Dactylopiibacterium carminicum]|uniref:Oligogalacturonate lyase domain-containing protein n=2 Tax=Candidatus Dactylopiibacterium carminicum TaxID=857335 RepID=A0A272EX60_9RHOO|nr:hypothetical protein BGI27_03285 [Candidatus Dactylopiibacterium carminicum]PAS94689.1 MAG: hypothetical protein CGU29_03030 [Candidatus Dactylopiibacterium carminicum]
MKEYTMTSPSQATPTLVTTGANANDQLLYFTSSSLSGSDDCLVFISDRSGHPNLYLKRLPDGEEVQLSANTEGTLKSYVYFNGNPRRGFGKASVSFDAAGRKLYYLQGDDIVCCDLQGNRRVLGRIPADQVTAFTHVSTDGQRLCIPTTDARALEAESFVNDAPNYSVGDGEKKNEVIADKPDYDIDARVQAENLNSYLNVYDTESGGLLKRERVSRAWITHVQFSPVDADVILYNHEWPGDCGIRRMWIWNGREHIRLRQEGDGRSRADWTCHEMWEADGSHIIYHGKYANGLAYVGRVDPQGHAPVEIALPAAYHRYGHFTAGNRHGNWLVSDGYYHPEGAPENENWGGEWICLQQVDWARRQIEWRPLCQHRSIWDCQDSHPHPIFNHADGAVFFTSNASGRRAVYRVAVPD